MQSTYYIGMVGETEPTCVRASRPTAKELELGGTFDKYGSKLKD